MLTSTAVPSPTEALVDNLLDWEPVPRPERFTGQFAFDGTWLVTQTMTDAGKMFPYVNLLARKMNETDREIFAFPEGKTAARYEWGSGMELVAGRLAFVVGPLMGDTTFGYEVWLFDLESGEKTQVKVSDRALPGIALSERWLAVLDSTSEQSETGERCIEVYALPGLARLQVFCTEDRINWPELSGDWLTYKRYAAGKEWETNFPSIETLNLVTGETHSTSTNSRAVSLKIYSSESLIAWQEDEQIVVWPRPGDPQKTLDKVRFGSNWAALQVCGERVYYTADHQGAMELRSWQMDGTVQVLHRYRGLTQFDPEYKDLPQYDFVEILCGRDWVMFQTSKADFFVAKDGK